MKLQSVDIPYGTGIRSQQIGAVPPQTSEEAAIAFKLPEAWICGENGIVRNFSYEDVFGLPHASLPSFDALHAVNVQDVLFDHELTAEDKFAVSKQLEPLHEICRKAHFTPLFCEFALITSKRQVWPRHKMPFFTSYVSTLLEPAEPLLLAYEAALRSMGEAGGEDVQIVPHPHLYNADTDTFARLFDDYASEWPQVAVPNASVDISPVSRFRVIRHPFAMLQEPRRQGELDERIRVFLRALSNSIVSTPAAAAVIPRLAESLFLVLPFVRPGYDSAASPENVSGVTKANLRGDPGGTIFLFLEPQDRSQSREDRTNDVKDIIRMLSSMLTEASIRESYRRESEERLSLSAVMVHSAGNALAMGDVDALRKTLFTHDGLKSAPTFELGRSTTPNQDKDFIRRTLNALACGYPRGRAFIGLAELTSSDGPLGRKFQTDTSYTLGACLKGALDMVAAHRDVRSGIAQLQVARTNWNDVQFPIHYLSDLYVQTFLYELLLNVGKFGYINPSTMSAPLAIRASFADQVLNVTVSNPVKAADNHPDFWDIRESIALPRSRLDKSYKRHSFLELFKVLSRYIPGIAIKSIVFRRKGDHWLLYEAKLSLSSMHVELDNDTVASIVPIHL